MDRVKRFLRRISPAALLVLLVSGVTATGLGRDGLADKAWLWRNWAAPDLVFADQFASPTEQMAYFAVLKPLAEPLRRARILNPPIGFVVRQELLAWRRGF